MTFSSPWSLLWLLAIPVLVALYVLHVRRRRRYAERWASPGCTCWRGAEWSS